MLVQAAPPDRAEFERRIGEVRRRIESAGGDLTRTRVVAVTKGFSADAVRLAASAGICDIGENYADELLQKADAVSMTADPTTQAPAMLRWHYIGAIQRRRVRELSPKVHLWETVSRAEEARSVASHSDGARVLIQVEATGQKGRNGCAPDAVADLAGTCRGLGLNLCGLMTMGVQGDAGRTEDTFATTASLAAELGLAELSMGMSDDLELAISRGSTMVRVGRALFGERLRKSSP